VSTVVITGASGFLGRHLLDHYLGTGRDVVALTRDRGRLDALSHPRLEVREVVYGGTLEIAPGSTVIYCAAMRNAPRASAAFFAQANTAEPENVARKAMRAGVKRFIHLGTALVLGSSAVPLDERAPMNAAGDPYVLSKCDGILALERLAREGLPLVTILPSIIYGPDQPGARSRVTSHMRRILSTPLRVAVAAPPRNLVFVDDVVRAIVQAEERGETGSRSVVAGEDVTPEAFELEVFAAAGRRPSPRIVIPSALATASARVLDAVLGYDVACGWSARVRTLLAPWCFRSVPTISELDQTPTALAEGVRRTVATFP
jgi:nucleoside-diphosphate-sugar epimerase